MGAVKLAGNPRPLSNKPAPSTAKPASKRPIASCQVEGAEQGEALTAPLTGADA